MDVVILCACVSQRVKAPYIVSQNIYYEGAELLKFIFFTTLNCSLPKTKLPPTTWEHSILFNAPESEETT